MPTNIYVLPSNLNAVHVIGVTPADHHRLAGTSISGFHEADRLGHPDRAFTNHGKIRPTVYFANGSRYTQSHVKNDNIGYHPPSGKHLFFGNVDKETYDRKRQNRREFRAYINGLIDPSGQSCSTMPPPLGEAFEGRKLLEIKEGGLIHPSRSALVSVSYREAVELVRSIRLRSGDKQKFEPTGEWHFGPAPFQ